MSLVSALSKLLVKMGGTPATGDNSDELVDKIADAYTPGGGFTEYLIYFRHDSDTNPSFYDITNSAELEKADFLDLASHNFTTIMHTRLMIEDKIFSIIYSRKTGQYLHISAIEYTSNQYYTLYEIELSNSETVITHNDYELKSWEEQPQE